MGGEEVAALLREHYGMSGALIRIATERDHTFRLTTEDDGSFLVKISFDTEPAGEIDLQVRAMLHAADRDPDLGVQQVALTLDGRASIELPHDTDGPHPRVLRVMRFIPGDMLAERALDPVGHALVGESLARLSHALADFTHPFQDRLLLWDLRSLSHLHPLADDLESAEVRNLAVELLARFANVTANESLLTTQVVHNDLSPYNLVLAPATDPQSAPRTRGIIDFGDVVDTALSYDLAVPMGNLLGTDPATAWEAPFAVLDAYLKRHPLSDADLQALPVTVPARVLLRMLVTARRSRLDPAGGAYLDSHSHADRARLTAALATDPDQLIEQISSIAAIHRPGARR